MFQLFKKYVIKNDQKLLPILKNMKLFKIKFLNEEEDFKREYNEDFHENFQLPHEVVGIELRDSFMLIIDKYKNQKGINADRCIYIFSRMEYSLKNNIMSYNTGLRLYTVLMGLGWSDELDEFDESKSESFETDESDEIKSLASTKSNVLYTIQTDRVLGPLTSKKFKVVFKKKVKELNVSNDAITDEYLRDSLDTYINNTVSRIYWYITYIQTEGIEIRESKNSKNNEYIVKIRKNIKD